MSEVVASSAPEGTPDVGLAARLIGVVFSPRDAYTAVAARPRWFGALAVSGLIFIAVNVIFQSTEVGKSLALDQQIQFLKAIGQEITPEAMARMQSQMRSRPIRRAARCWWGCPWDALWLPDCCSRSSPWLRAAAPPSGRCTPWWRIR